MRTRLRRAILAPAVAAGKDAARLLLVVLMVPIAILLVGTPVALLARLLIEIAARW